MPFFFGDIHLFIAVLLTTMIFLALRKRIDRYIINYILVFVALMLVHVMTFSLFQFGPFLGVVIRLFYAFMVIKIIGKEFPDIFINTMYWFTVVSLVMWVILAFVPGMYELARGISTSVIQPLELYPHERDNLIFYTNGYWMQHTPPRNAGPFWEPGGFGVFLVVSIVFNTIRSSSLINKKNIIFFIATLTTFSLSTFASLFFMAIFYAVFIKGISRMSTLLFIFAFIALSVWSFNEFEFLGEKLIRREIRAQAETQQGRINYEDLNAPAGRNIAARLDMQKFLENPVLGEGVFHQYRFGSSASGITSILRQWGVVGFLIMFGSMYFSFRRYVDQQGLPRAYAFFAVFTMIVVALPQALYGKPFFMAMIFLFLIQHGNNNSAALEKGHE